MRPVPRILLLVAIVLLAPGCRPAVPLAERLERDLLLRQRAALERELAMPPEALQSDVVVVVPAALIDRLLEVALPVEALIAERYLVTATAGRVDFTGGLALVRLDARVTWADRADVAADVAIHGILQILDITDSGTLASRVEILGFETQEVRLGTLSPPAGRLLDELARRPAGELNELLARLEIPVRLAPAITLPRVEEPELTIEAAEIPLRAQLREARVGGGQLWIHIDVAIAAEAAAEVGAT
jgi:hypothetical protein